MLDESLDLMEPTFERRFARVNEALNAAVGLRPGGGRFKLYGGVDRLGGDWRALGGATLQSRISKSWLLGLDARGVWRGRDQLDAEATIGIEANW